MTLAVRFQTISVLLLLAGGSLSGADRLTRIRQLTFGGQNAEAYWSPDGKQIAFTSVRDGNHEIYVSNTDGTNLRRVTNHPSRDDYPIWHPDGKRLVIVSQRKGDTDLYLIELK